MSTMLGSRDKEEGDTSHVTHSSEQANCCQITQKGKK